MRVHEELRTTFNSWKAMRGRCLDPKNVSYARYGARGITVCPAWNSFRAFLADMGKRPDGTTIDRRDNNGNYEPGNCRWATKAEQTANRNPATGLGLIEFNGRAQTANAWVLEIGFGKNTITRRLRKGWTVERALTEPGRNHTKATGVQS